MVRMRELLLGNPEGKTLWQKAKIQWNTSKQAESWQRDFARVYNPYRLQPNDLVEIEQTLEKRSFKVETILYYITEGDDPNYTRYGLRDMLSQDVVLLEVMPDGDLFLVSMFELVDEFERDEGLIQVIDEEDTLKQTDLKEGKPVETTYQKDFMTTAEVWVFSQDEKKTMSVTSANYFVETEDSEQYLVVELLETYDWMNFYKGHKIRNNQVTAYGSVKVN